MNSTIDRARNRARIVTLIVLATLNYCVAAVIGATVTGVAIVVWILAKAGDVPDTLDGLKWLGIGAGAVVVVSAIVGGVIAVVRIPTLRRNLERQVLAETGATMVEPETTPETAPETAPETLPRVRNLLDGLAIAAGIPAPRFCVIADPAPNSFGIGTKPDRTIIGVTQGLIDALSRDELEAILAYEITRVASWDVAMASWTAALTGRALTAVGAGDTAVFGAPSRWITRRLQVWALRGQGRSRDAAAMAVSRNPASLVRALECLAANPLVVASITTVTAPLWIEIPESLVTGDAATRSAPALGPLLLSKRIVALREMAHLPSVPLT